MFAERYELGPLIGSGGSGHVHRGTDHALGRTVAMKVLGREHAHDEQARDRFRAEAVLAASVQHANVVPVLDAVEDDGELCIVMEYVDGPTLAQYVRTMSPDVDEALELLHGIAAGLAAAHLAGLVHRDLKPANVLLSHGVPRVVDFGLAHVVADGPDPTRTIRGSAGYLAPEQARGEDVSVRTDVYALGCLAMFLLSGSPPFAGDTPLAIVGQHLHADPPDLAERNPDVPPEVVAAVHRALAKDPAERQPSAAAFAAAIGRPLPHAATDSMPAGAGEMATLTHLPADPDSIPSSGSGPSGGSTRPPASFGSGAEEQGDLRRRAAFSSGTLGNGRGDESGVITWVRTRPRTALLVGAALLGLALVVPTVGILRDDRTAGAVDDEDGIPQPSDIAELSTQLREEVVALGESNDQSDERLVQVLDALARVDTATVSEDDVATDAAARDVLDLVADMVDQGAVTGDVAGRLLGLAGELVGATSTDEAADAEADDQG